MPATPPHASPEHAIYAPRLFDGGQFRERVVVQISGGRIVASVAADRPPPDAHILPADTILAPGFIDLQVNGGGGALLNGAPTAATVHTMLAAHRAHGTTGFLPTLITDHSERLHDLAASAAEIAQIPGVLGVHLEGPFLNLLRRGVHPPQFIRAPQPNDLKAIQSLARVLPVLVTLAPECVPPGFIRQLVALGVRVAIGHSDATAEQAAAACEEGATGITHLYNAMSQLTGRAPGVVGTAFDDARLTAGIIADGLHVSPANLRTALKAMGPNRLALVTDAMPSLGAVAPAFQLHGRAITLANGKLTAPDGTLAGAHLGMLEAVRNATTLMGATLADALAMASRVPAGFLGLSGTRGHIAPGYVADLVAFTETFELVGNWIGGARLTRGATAP
jgi:N-acetylglucosamine-6-phosphate deacetylase